MGDGISHAKHPKFDKDDLIWTLSLFGTAIGAGVLFLPINAGVGGLIPLLVVLFLAFPMTFLAHRGLCRFVLGSDKPADDITFVAETYFGKGGGFLVTLLYFFAILPILLVYSANLTTTLSEFFIHQLGLEAPNRLISSFLIVGILMLVSISGSSIVTKAMSLLVFPFIIILMVIACFLIPHWNGAIFENISFVSLFSSQENRQSMIVTLWLVVPVLVFSFNHSPIISSLACHCKEKYRHYAEPKSSQIIGYAVALMVVVVMFFVFSCALCLTPEDFATAKTQNVNILTYIANKFPEATFLAYVSPIVALIAMSKSFLGHYLGSAEGLNGILYKVSNGKLQGKFAHTITAVITFLIAWFVAYKNPSVIGIIESIGGPVLAVLLFLMPAYAIYKFDVLKKYRNKWTDIFVVIMGLIGISAAIKGLL
ncbi:serine/threonine protein kinase [Helicobacter didelphidarum]|uniref:Serine/threonine protein kinase n=1 Tax=Helicobacter didelphidarum TaxID=2040648 RepID=A0A3D8IR09_9HELI|nr:aromatic amino acid transport family protein [Helicobacter didelphidarum]RDU67728.1 serine/threonine protein kinase [Helicobacter didelphidarum]